MGGWCVGRPLPPRRHPTVLPTCLPALMPWPWRALAAHVSPPTPNNQLRNAPARPPAWLTRPATPHPTRPQMVPPVPHIVGSPRPSKPRKPYTTEHVLVPLLMRMRRPVKVLDTSPQVGGWVGGGAGLQGEGGPPWPGPSLNTTTTQLAAPGSACAGCCARAGSEAPRRPSSSSSSDASWAGDAQFSGGLQGSPCACAAHEDEGAAPAWHRRPSAAGPRPPAPPLSPRPLSPDLPPWAACCMTSPSPLPPALLAALLRQSAGGPARGPTGAARTAAGTGLPGDAGARERGVGRSGAGAGPGAGVGRGGGGGAGVWMGRGGVQPRVPSANPYVMRVLHESMRAGPFVMQTRTYLCVHVCTFARA